MIRRRTPKKRGTVLLEFVLILPMFLFLILFTIDMGRYLLVAGALGDATYVGTRAVAQSALVQTADGTNVGQRAFDEAINSLPFLSNASNAPDAPSISSFTLVSTDGGQAGVGQVCSNALSPYVIGKGSVTVDLVTPGLSALLGVIGSEQLYGGSIQIEQIAQLRCEVIRG